MTGNLAPVDQVVHHVLRPHVALPQSLNAWPSWKTMSAAGIDRVVLRGDIDPVGVLRARIGLARKRERPPDLSLGNALLRHRVGRELVIAIGIRRLEHRGPLGRRLGVGGGGQQQQNGSESTFHDVMCQDTTGNGVADAAATFSARRARPDIARVAMRRACVRCSRFVRLASPCRTLRVVIIPPPTFLHHGLRRAR